VVEGDSSHHGFRARRRCGDRRPADPRPARRPRPAVAGADPATMHEDGSFHTPRTSVVALENTHNNAGGTVWPVEELQAVVSTARELGLKLHLDGARLLNAAVATGVPARDLAAPFDTVSLCLSKGLGCPLGALIAGSRDLMLAARREKQPLRRGDASGRDRRGSRDLRPRPQRQAARPRTTRAPGGSPRHGSHKACRSTSSAYSRTSCSSTCRRSDSVNGRRSTSFRSVESRCRGRCVLVCFAPSHTSISAKRTSTTRWSSCRKRSEPVSASEALDRLLAERQADRLPSVAAAVAREGQIVWSNAIGSARLRDRGRGQAEHAIPDRLDHEDVHGHGDHAAGRRGSAPARRPARAASGRDRKRVAHDPASAVPPLGLAARGRRDVRDGRVADRRRARRVDGDRRVRARAGAATPLLEPRVRPARSAGRAEARPARTQMSSTSGSSARSGSNGQRGGRLRRRPRGTWSTSTRARSGSSPRQTSAAPPRQASSGRQSRTSAAGPPSLRTGRRRPGS